MIKHFCDVCGKEVEGLANLGGAACLSRVTYKAANVSLEIMVGNGRSTNAGDLCIGCFSAAVSAAISNRCAQIRAQGMEAEGGDPKGLRAEPDSPVGNADAPIPSNPSTPSSPAAGSEDQSR